MQRVVETPGRSEARYRTLVDHLPDMAVVTFDRDMRYDLAAGRALSTLDVEQLPQLDALHRAALDGRESSLEVASETEPARDLWLRSVPLRGEGDRVQGGMLWLRT